ncbi:complement factor H-related protein 2-like [Pseudorasbora parva]|uniref:complement factor H-related protein 2-like n=1 Tax=Pseudorasbora parva TaxID=51549 RepID=UPI00351E8B9E
MRVPVKLLGFVFWLFFFNCGRCQEITCTAPVILNGEVIERVQEYRKDAILKYRCYQGFKPREGSPKCARFGWTLNPECDEITCVLPSTPFGVKKNNPAGKTIFRVGERVEITCFENHWLRTREYTHSFTCRDDGQWDHQPVCEEIRCEVPRNQHVYWSTYYFSGDKRLGVKISYSCEAGYVQTAAEATCTRDGWTPNPLCAERMCAAPNISNADIVGDRRPNYRINSTIQYKCNTGFEPEQPVQITCNSWTEWTGIQQCTGKCGPPPNVDFADTIEMIKKEYDSEERVEYICFNKYTLVQDHHYTKYMTCENGEWRGNIRCLKPCTVTVEEMDKRGIQLRWGGRQKIFVAHHDRIVFVCQRGKYLTVNELIQICYDGVMILPECE